MKPDVHTEQIGDNSTWKRLLQYYKDCLIEENRLNYIIGKGDVPHLCYFPDVPGDFLSENQPSLEIRPIDHGLENIINPQRSDSFRSVCFGYPFLVDFDGNVIPLLYVVVSVTGDHRNGVVLRRDSDLEINYAALWQVLPGDSDRGDIDVNRIFELFDQLEVRPGESRFEKTLSLLIEQIEKVAAHPLKRLGREAWTPDSDPRFSVVERPVLFLVRNPYTYHLLKELDNLLHSSTWDQVPLALRQLLTRVDETPYPQAPAVDRDPRLYVVPANDRQRQAVTSASQRLVTVVTGPPGTGKSQLIVNIVGDAVLRGETVLIASRNNRAVDVIHERFLGQVKYPGTVRTGRKEFRDRLPEEMQRALSPVERGSIRGNMEEAQREYLALLRDIDQKSREIEQIRSLLRDKELYCEERETFLRRLPDSLGESTKKVFFSLDEQQSEQLISALRSLEKSASGLMERKQELTMLLQTSATGMSGELERLLGTPLPELRLDKGVESFEDIEHHLDTWDSLQRVVSLSKKKRTLEKRVVETRGIYEAAAAHLPPDLAAELTNGLQRPNMQRVAFFRQSLAEIVNEAEGLAKALQPLADHLLVAASHFPAPSRLMEIWTEPGAGELNSETVDLGRTHRFFALENEFLETHQWGVRQASLQRQLKTLEQERARKLAEFEQQRLSIGEQLTAIRTQIPALWLLRLEEVNWEAIRENRAVWKKRVQHIRALSDWLNRIHTGNLSGIHRLMYGVFPGWVSQRIRTMWRDISLMLHEIGFRELDEPGKSATWSEWAAYLQGVDAFIQACWLMAQQQDILEQQEAYRKNAEKRIAEASSQLEQAEAALSMMRANLPEYLAQAMEPGVWPYEPVAAAFHQSLTEAKQYMDLALQKYTAVIERLEETHLEYGLSDSLRAMIHSLKVEEGTASEIRPSLRSLRTVLSLSLQFCDAVEALDAWQNTERELEEVEHTLEEYLGKLPVQIRGIDFAAQPVEERWLQDVQTSVNSLQAYLNECLQEWQVLRQQTLSVLLENSLKVPALSKALRRASTDPAYLNGLTDPQNYERPEQLLENIRIWHWVLGTWIVHAELSRIGQALSALPSLEKAQREIELLRRRRIQLAGKLLAEKWNQTAAELDRGTIRQIHEYVDALSQGNKSRSAATQYYFDAVLKLFPVWLTTNLSTQDLPLRPGLFDIVVIDEASQCDIPSAIPLLFRGKRLVIIGDENQLPHVATLPDKTHRKLMEYHQISSRYSYSDTSLFKLSSRSVAKVPGHITLSDHYRSYEEIIQFANENFYGGELRVCTDLSALPPVYRNNACGVFWVHIKGRAERPRPKHVYNPQEIQTVVNLVKKLLEYLKRVDFRDGDIEIGIVTPFRAQAERLEEALKNANVPCDRILVGTVHTYQGNERDVMIFSTTVTNDLPEETRKFVLLKENLLNVAVTRARWTLIVVGDHEFFMEQPMRSPYYALAEYVQKRNRVFPRLENLPFLQTEEESQPGLSRGMQVRPDTPYSNRMTLRSLLASCREYIWWYDPYMSLHALDALATALHGTDSQIREIRLLTSEQFWENKEKEPLCLTKDDAKSLERELKTRGTRLEIAVTHWDFHNPPPHDRFLFSAGCAINMPPIRSIYENARLAEFLPSTVTPGDFEEWWKRARRVFP